MDSISNDLFKHSVTANDMSHYQGNGVIQYMIPWGMYFPYDFPLPTELPPEWIYPASFANYSTRDLVLRKTTRHEPFWAATVSKAASKLAAKSFEIKGNRVERFKDMIVQMGGDGYVPSQKRTVKDYLTTNNGTFLEIVRVSDAAMSRTIGLVHLDSLRVFRTNDPDIPYLFKDLKGQYHELREDQIIAMVDMPNTELASFGRGICAADDLYQQIYKTAVIVQYGIESVTGMGANALNIVSGVNDQQLQGVLQDGKTEAIRRGQIRFQGRVILGILNQVDLKNIEIKLRDLPLGYVKLEEMREAQLAYADRVGLDPQDINPDLIGHKALGSGAQSVVLHEKQEGSTLSTYEKELTHQIDNKVLPTRMSFHFDEADLSEKEKKAQIGLVHAQTRQTQVTTGEITAQEARQLAIEAEDMPGEIQVETLADEEKPVDSGAEQPAEVAPPVEAAPAQPAQPAQPAPAAPVTTQKEIEVLVALKESIDKARELMRDQSDAQPAWMAEQVKAAA